MNRLSPHKWKIHIILGHALALTVIAGAVAVSPGRSSPIFSPSHDPPCGVSGVTCAENFSREE